MDICTIIAKNYLAYARVLARTFAQQHPGSRCFTLVIDDPDGYIDPASEPFELVRSADLPIDDFEQMAATFRLSAVRPSAPAHVALDLEAPRFAELDRIKGAVVVNFFATWCGPCREEMPLLAQRQKRANGRFTVLAVNTRDDASAVPSFLKQVGVSFPLAYDRDGRLSDAYQLFGVPQTFFLDARHVVRDESAGPLTPESLERGLRKAGAA